MGLSETIIVLVGLCSVVNNADRGFLYDDRANIVYKFVVHRWLNPGLCPLDLFVCSKPEGEWANSSAILAFHKLMIKLLCSAETRTNQN